MLRDLGQLSRKRVASVSPVGTLLSLTHRLAVILSPGKAVDNTDLRHRNRMEAFSLHAAPILFSAQKFPEATQPPVNRQLAVAEILDERPPEKEGAVAERLVAVKAQILENQRECGERGTE